MTVPEIWYSLIQFYIKYYLTSRSQYPTIFLVKEGTSKCAVMILSNVVFTIITL